ncbi:phosphoribosylamine--glycine ligase [Thiospirillum jenense]|uniref:Phosphoribosylamine--glycine ligase n=1 Tax=Thiospirillum jenense TaxID=1653858 RepID=A0A839HFY7_9GAMM|nr:phosphoribosylamine--glycine ligase [Thiospirillum jenense]MBB1127304.1 phosphoribosylamine--glycine ligase [Thiospirillum jenense]
MNVLIIGSGGREHALAWKIRQSLLAEMVFVAPGNAGTAGERGIINVDIDPSDHGTLINFAHANEIGLTIVGPEAPLVAGITDIFTIAGLCCLGPTQAAAQLEGSKTFAKEFMTRHGIPTAAYQSFNNEHEALTWLHATGAPVVIKADGLAAGKGVILAPDMETAELAIHDLLGRRRFGAASKRIIIEEWLQGEEASFIAMVDGRHILPLATAQDHKARDDGDQGPNTGGMGAYSPAPVVTPELYDRIMREVIQPTVVGLEYEGRPYCGFLYAGLMIKPDGTLSVLEYNCRLGDPETQPILMRLRSDFVSLCLAATNGELDRVTAEWDARPALGVVMAAGGYPNEYQRGDVISGLPDNKNTECKVFHAGTRFNDANQLVTAGGRVLCVTALGNDLITAQQRAYATCAEIQFNGAFYRRDIGHRAIGR